MRSTVGGPPGTLGHEQACSSNNNTSNNNASGEINGNSGSQYALCALGVGLIALGIVMIVWSVVPATPLGNSSSGGDSAGEGRKNKASSVAFVLTGCGVAMLLLSLCLGMRNKRREQQLREAQNHSGAPGRDQEQRETAEQQAQRYAVPTYEEAVCSGQNKRGDMRVPSMDLAKVSTTVWLE
ncbi:transmembrane protein 51a [Neolamprologus brichardi]|uniref:transmembrane protein 51a n=1 Tax=Neolamprologus brichardi TaxID=32507 RepID=UPI0003EBB8C1|nr:transmembrane protein 51a [Neolamprologus brichardi]